MCHYLYCLGLKTVGLCLEKTPNTDRWNWKPNFHKMRDLMTNAVVANEERMKRSEIQREYKCTQYQECNTNSPKVSERIHVGNKTSVLGSVDLVTDTGMGRKISPFNFELHN